MRSTLSEKILSRAAGHPVRAGDIISLDVDRVMLHDSLAPSVIRLLREELDCTQLAAPERVALAIDHVSPAATTRIAEAHAALRRWAHEQKLADFFDSGRGIAHQLLIEEQLVRPGEVAVGTDSHSTSYGAVGAFGSGMGSTDVAFLLATGSTWMRVPETIRIRCRGRLSEGVSAKDLALFVAGELRADGATYAALEYHGLESFSVGARTTVASMAVEVGAKAGLVICDGLPRRWSALVRAAGECTHPDPGASYRKTLDVDLTRLRPMVALPNEVDNVCSLERVESELAVDVVYLGTCTNGRHEDFAAAARIMQGRPLAPGLRMMIVPASQRELQAAVADGTIAVLLASGATLGPPGCGACIGRHMGVLAPGEVCVFTGNRNFVGRMGSPDARIILASPEVAAATALTGVLSAPQAQELETEEVTSW